MTSVFERVTSQAKPRDYVSFHYSGHGTRLPPCFDFSNQSTGDLALVLLEGDQSPELCLRGPRLARLLKDMVDKELVVTLILDCCFSAAVHRNSGLDVRYLPYGRTAASTHSLYPKDNLVERSTRSANRDASMRDNWLVEPDRYAILAACGPHENAKGGFRGVQERVNIRSFVLFLIPNAL
jgi:hypothetical protein